jgi:tRNA pseudouridine55 synthase
MRVEKNLPSSVLDSPSPPKPLNGILVLDKPEGMTSHDCVARMRRATRMKRIGHAGTLDPMATGVLILCLGQATRLSEYLMEGTKTYQAEITFGATTDTQDRTGRILKTGDASRLNQTEFEAALREFVGEGLQTPPMVSAVHHEGARLYELARKGIEVERKPRPVTFYEFQPLRFMAGETPRAEIVVRCSPGTYIRTLAHDLGEALGCGAHLSALRRIESGGFTLSDAVTLDDATEAANAGNLESALVPMRRALKGATEAEISEAQCEEIRRGRALPTDLTGERIALIDPSGELIALARAEDSLLKPYKVFIVEAQE